VGVFWVKVADGHDPLRVIEAIDALFENGPQRVRTQTESMFQAQFASMFGGLPMFLAWIGGAVVFAIFFSVLNTAQMAARERARDVGVLKALGFRDGTAGRLLLVESMLVVGPALLGRLGWLSGPAFAGCSGSSSRTTTPARHAAAGAAWRQDGRGTAGALPGAAAPRTVLREEA
jgi:predicted lysophospholipase L1 biosynthesis ABC-type transport system permease subunit